ncbi:MAG: adenine nucleotide alpha hydrolase, partial [Alphaproteobacteria bacterium]|nr:adenine nucleotide alpha hydrolase [Alphaproteobacteria bacterium]
MTEALAAVLEALPRVALAVSGGVDSMTLAHFAQRRLGPGRTAVYHAVSPAVPPEATARVHEHARRFGWDVHIVDAG